MKQNLKKFLDSLGLLGIIRKIIAIYHGGFSGIIFKSQKGQDLWVLSKIIGFKRNGYFIELAAADGITHSNTWFMEIFLKWNGICIEPNPIFYEKLKKNRNCKLSSSIISDKVELVNFRIDNGQLGGIVADDTDNNYSIRGNELKNAKIITKESITLTDLLDTLNAPNIIDYFSLDVEGSEERVLRSLDFNKYIFKCITVERPNCNVNEILFSNNYKFVKNYRYDSFYVHNSILEDLKITFEPFEQVPTKDW
jgi:FkbM family methyltransferase